jgi:hypothetical protein
MICILHYDVLTYNYGQLRRFLNMKNKLILALSMTALLFAHGANAQDTATESTATNSTNSTFPKLHSVQDKEGYMPHAAVMLGVANPEGSYDAAPEFGVDVGFQPYVPFGLGAMFLSSSNNSKNDSRNLDRTSLLARATYNFGGTIPVIRNSYVGAAAGPVWEMGNVDVGVAPLIGFDIPLSTDQNQKVSLGAQAKYLIVSSNESDGLSVNGVVKYWF